MSCGQLLNVAGIIGIHDTVVQVRDLPCAAGFVILQAAYDTNFIANCQDLKALAVEVVAVVDGHAVVHVGFCVIAFHVNTIVVIGGNDTLKGNLHAVVSFGIGPQLLQGQLLSLAVVEVRVLLTGVDIQLLRFGLVNGLQADLAVAVVAGVAGDSQTLLQDLNVQVPVLFTVCGLIPDPAQITVTGGVSIPGCGIRLNNDRGCGGKLFLGKGGGLLAILLDLTGGLGGVYCQVTSLQHTAGHYGRRNIEVGGVTVNKLLNGNLLLGSTGGRIQLNGSGVVHYLCRWDRGGGVGSGLLLALVAAGEGGEHQAQKQN